MRVVHGADSIRVSRPVLRTIMGALIFLLACESVRVSLFAHIATQERTPRGDWWYLVLAAVVMAAGYCYVASTLEVTATAVVIQNPLRRIVIPIGHVTSVREGSNLRVETDYGHAYAWGVEAANIDLVINRLSKQEGLAEMILARAAQRRDADTSLPPARYRWTLPPLFVLLMAPVYLALSLVIAAGWHPTG